MTYGDRLKRWVVVLLLPKMQRVDIARFYKYSDAEGHAQTLRRLNPIAHYEVMFDVGEEDRSFRNEVSGIDASRDH